jgi:hypothetical protein
MTWDDEAVEADGRPSVFGATDQGDMIARIDATSEDDLSSSFFDSSIQDVEDAAVRMFDIGIRTMTDDPDAAPKGFATRVPARPTTASVVHQPVATRTALRLRDPDARAAFILGGPAALSR